METIKTIEAYKLPKYQSHKRVNAVLIERLKTHLDGTATITPAGELPPFQVSWEYVKKHNPQAGGYYVVYEDGYASWSPKDAFEKGYTLIK